MGFKGTAAVVNSSGSPPAPKPSASPRANPTPSSYSAAPAPSSSGAEHELVTAAREQASEALEIAKEAESMIPGLSSAMQKQAVQAGIAELRDWASKVRSTDLH